MIRRTPPRGRWFKRVMWLGILANLALAVPTLLAPDTMIEFIGLPMATPLLWPRFAGLLLILLSLFYMPAAIDPSAIVSSRGSPSASRLAGVVFFVSVRRPTACSALRPGVPRAAAAPAAGRGQRRRRIAAAKPAASRA